jgi:hypothetical protein
MDIAEFDVTNNLSGGEGRLLSLLTTKIRAQSPLGQILVEQKP